MNKGIILLLLAGFLLLLTGVGIRGFKRRVIG
jgi:hypothetical protein